MIREITYAGDELQSDPAILRLNSTIQAVLQKYLPRIDDKPIDIRFDIPDKTSLPDHPTVCVFLYDIQEDLELRHGQSRQYRAETGTFGRRQVNVRCCYLVTYWEQPTKSGMGPDSQPMVVVNAVLNALLNANLEKEIPPSFSRVIAPSEHLSSLGNFWQSLGDRPRLCLNFQVTVPVELGLGQQIEQAPPVLSTTLQSALGQSWGDYDKSLPFKCVLVDKVLTSLKNADQMQSARGQLARLAVTCEYREPDDLPTIHVIGLLDQATYDAVTKVIAEVEWEHLIGVKESVNVTELKKVELTAG